MNDQERPLHIAFISLHTSPDDRPGTGDAGGMNVVELHQAHALAARGHQVELVTRRTSADQWDVLELGPGVRLRRITAGPTESIAKSRQNALIAEFSNALDTIADPAWDVIHSQHWMSGVAALPVARRLGIPHVQSFHSVAALPGSPLAEGEPPESEDRIAGEALIATQSDLVIAVSGYEANTIISRCGAPAARVSVIRPGVDTENFNPEGPSFEWASIGATEAPPNGVALFAARLQPLKGVDLAIRALGSIPAQQRPLLVLAGETSADHQGYADELVGLIKAEGMLSSVIFTGSSERTDLAAMLRTAQLVMVPSYSETFGLIALEALASGTPVAIWAGAGGLNEIVDETNGLVFADRDPGHWGRGIEELLGDPGRRAELSAAGVQKAARFSWAGAAKKLVEAYIELLEAWKERAPR